MIMSTTIPIYPTFQVKPFIYHKGVPRTFYKVEIGVLLPITHKEYEDYNNVYDKKHSYYDENVFFFTNKKEAISYARKHALLKENSYVVVSKLSGKGIEMNETQLDEFHSTGFIYDYHNMWNCECLWGTKDVIYNRKNENGKLKKIF